MNALRMAWRMCSRQWRAGELRILAFSLVVAVAAVTAVGFFTDRVQQVLGRQSNLLLGADLVVSSQQVLPGAYLGTAREHGLRAATAMIFPSMVTYGEASLLGEIKAVSEGYPLRGNLRVADQPYGVERTVQTVPSRGEVWLESRLAVSLGVRAGDAVELGARRLIVAAILSYEPDRGGDLFSIAPRLLMNANDVAGTALIQFGSRVNYRLLVAGDDAGVRSFKSAVGSRLQKGERIEDVSDARPEIRSVLTKARQFLGLAAMASVIMAAVAMALSCLRFMTRNIDTCALMRCLGAQQGFITRVYLLQLLLVGLVGGILGCALGYLAQEALSRMLGGLLTQDLPGASWHPMVQGLLVGFAVLLGVAWPLLRGLRNVPALRVLRLDLPLPGAGHVFGFLPVVVVLVALVMWTSQDRWLGIYAFGGMVGFLLLAALLAWLGVRLLQGASRARAGSWRFGVSNLARHPLTSVATVAGFSLGLMALLLLTVVRGDLMRNWQASLPADAPNRFVINIQPEQLADLQKFFATAGLPVPAIQPMVRGRLVAVNGRPLDLSRYDERGRRLAEREFNLSWASEMQADNRLVSGRWWRADEAGQPMLSLEQGIAETLGLHLGDWLTYESGGKSVKVRVTSLRKVEWDSMRANFFAITAPGVLDGLPASYITSFYLPPTQEGMLNRMVKAFPNFTVIDVAAIMNQVRAVMDRMSQAVQFVFGFSLLAGGLVLVAAISATRDARTQEYTVLRVLGARVSQLRTAMLVEFALVATLAGGVGAGGASVSAWVLSRQVLHLPYQFDPFLLLWGVGSAVAMIPLVAWWGLRDAMRQPPRQILNGV